MSILEQKIIVKHTNDFHYSEVEFQLQTKGKRVYKLDVKYESGIFDARIALYPPGCYGLNQDVWSEYCDLVVVSGRAMNLDVACLIAIAEAKNFADAYHLPLDVESRCDGQKCKWCKRIMMWLKIDPKPSCDTCGRTL